VDGSSGQLSTALGRAYRAAQKLLRIERGCDLVGLGPDGCLASSPWPLNLPNCGQGGACEPTRGLGYRQHPLGPGQGGAHLPKGPNHDPSTPRRRQPVLGTPQPRPTASKLAPQS
jgi:hypothetical protein